MRVCFLDFDGVLNGKGTTDRISEREIDELMKHGPYMGSFGGGMTGADPALVARLNRIVSAHPDVEVVVSSSWRFMFNVAAIRKILEARGFVGNVVDETPKGRGHRGTEIATWLESRSGIEAFVILEDGLDILPEQNPNWVRTDYRTGLTDEDVEKAIQILAGVPKVDVVTTPTLTLVNSYNTANEKFRVRWKEYTPPGEVPFEVSFDLGVTWSSGIEALASVKIWGGTSEFAAAIPARKTP